MSTLRWTVLIFVLSALTSGPLFASTRICVEVELQNATVEEPPTPVSDEGESVDTEAEDGEDPKKKEKGWVWDPRSSRWILWEDLRKKLEETGGALDLNDSVLPIGQSPLAYLKRLVEHFVTHEKGFEAVSDNCDQAIRIEMYPLQEGWTVFSRYTGNGREERVDRLYSKEFSQFAERAVLALLSDVPISSTINRENVLESDSRKYEQRIKGTHHFIMGVGTQLRGGAFDTANDEGVATSGIRLFTPVTASLGYRGKFESWGLEALAQVGIGVTKTASRKNSQGGHIDFGGDAGIQLHFLHYFNPRGLTSLYLGGGGTFELLWFSAIKAESERMDGDRSWLFGGGLNVDGVVGWEFMRASTVQFCLEAAIQLPVYALKTSNDHGSMNTWFPGISIRLGVMF